MGKRLYTESDYKKFAESYRKGLSLTEVAIRFGTTPPTVRKALDMFHVPVRDSSTAVMKRRHLQVKNKLLVLKHYREGQKPSEISKRTGLGYFVVCDIINRSADRTGEITDIDKVRALMTAGWSIDAIAVEFHTDRKCARNAVEIALKQIRKERENEIS